MLPEMLNNHTNLTISLVELRTSEVTVWVISFVLITAIGMFARYLDYLENKKDGKLRLLFTNLFCATFTSLTAIIFISVTIVQAGQSSFEGFRNLLIGKSVLSPLQEYQACIMNASMLGYMFQDMVCRFASNDLRWAYIIHHGACVAGLLLCLWFDQTAMYTSAAGLSEASTPLVSVIEIADAAGLGNLYFACGALLNIVFPIRVAFFTWVTYLWAFEHVHAPLGQGMTTLDWELYTLQFVGFISIVTLTLLNWYWYFGIFSASVRMVIPGKAKEKNT